jgi:hypothetical protein
VDGIAHQEQGHPDGQKARKNQKGDQVHIGVAGPVEEGIVNKKSEKKDQEKGGSEYQDAAGGRSSCARSKEGGR